MMQRPPRPTRTGTLVPYTTVFRSGLGRDVQRDLGGGQDVDHRLGRHAVGEDGVDLVHMGEAHHGVAAELGMIGGERSEEHTSELQSLMRISYAVFCLKKKHSLNVDGIKIIRNNDSNKTTTSR